MTEQLMQPALSDALDRLWKQFLPQIEERIELVDAAGRALAAGRMTDDQRDRAQSAAHKLAGVLGTFGLTRGTVLAREAEMLCAGDADPACAGQLIDIAAHLRVIIHERG